jgi:3-dehydroquinate synthase
VNFRSEISYLSRLPSSKEIAEHPIVIFDRQLLKNADLKRWLEKFPNRCAVEAGEDLKQLSSFEHQVNRILKIVERLQVKNITFVGIGGGSVGDFVGFLASVFKRGVPLIHIPSTWLAAIDSSHGGKTALNAGGYKNQIGSFYPAKRVILSRSLLFTQTPARVTEAMGEVLKTVLLSGGSLWNSISQESRFDEKILWSYLTQLVEFKYKIVKRDPLEKKGLRYSLNLGHTFGHIFEATHKIPHGVAVNMGLRMAIEFSAEKGLLKDQDRKKVYESPLMSGYLAKPTEVLKYLRKTKELSSFLLQDKKISKKGCLHFVFLVKPGKPKVLEVPVQEMIAFAKRLSDRGLW